MDEWKQKIIKERLGGKTDWTDEERAALCRQLDEDFDKRLKSLEKSESKPQDGWTEDNWREQMAEHPLFAPYVSEDGEAPLNPLSEGLAQLKFAPEHNSPVEVAQNYKEEGILQFKYKKYKLAIANFAEGIKQNCPDNELNAQLYNNRAAAHSHLGNYRSAIKDCQKAIELNPNYIKAIHRGVQCSTQLKSWSEVISWCDIGLKLDPQEEKLKSSRLQAVKEQKIKERDERRRNQQEKKKETEETNLIEAIQSRGIKLGTSRVKGSSSIELKDLEPRHPAAQGSRVHINENGKLVWPVMFLYPEHQQTDFIQEFVEDERIDDHINVMFGAECPPAPWDTDGKYEARSLEVYFEDKEKESLLRVDKQSTLHQVLTNPRYCVYGGTPGLILLVKGSKFMEEFLNKYK